MPRFSQTSNAEGTFCVNNDQTACMKTINCTNTIHVRNRGRYLDKEVNWEIKEGNTKIEVYNMMGSVCCVTSWRHGEQSGD